MLLQPALEAISPSRGETLERAVLALGSGAFHPQRDEFHLFLSSRGGSRPASSHAAPIGVAGREFRGREAGRDG